MGRGGRGLIRFPRFLRPHFFLVTETREIRAENKTLRLFIYTSGILSCWFLPLKENSCVESGGFCRVVDVEKCRAVTGCCARIQHNRCGNGSRSRFFSEKWLSTRHVSPRLVPESHLYWFSNIYPWVDVWTYI